MKLAVNGPLVERQRLVFKKDEDEETLDIGDGHIKALCEETQVHSGKGWGWPGALGVGLYCVEADALQLRVEDGVDGFFAQFMQEVAYNTGKEGLRADDVLDWAPKCRLKCVHVVRAKALGQLHDAADRVFDLQDGFDFWHLLQILGPCRLISGTVGQTSDDDAHHERVVAPFMVALTEFRERLVKFRKRQVPQFLFAAQDSLALADEGNVRAVAGDGLHDDGNALENTFELLPFFAIAEHGRRKSVSARRI